MKASVKAITAGLITALGIGIAGSAAAATPWQHEQARRAQAARIIQHEDARINHLLRTGRITPWQARQMHRDVHARPFAYGPHRY